MDIEIYRNRGLSGLSNLGATCFINSCMQILSHTYDINMLLDKEAYKSKLNEKIDTILLVEWDNLRKLLWQTNCVVSPNRFIVAVQKIAKYKKKDLFTGYSQNDLPEFLLFVIDCFHNSLAREIKMSVHGSPETETDKVAIQCFEMIKQSYEKDYSEFWNMFYAVHVSEISDLQSGEKLKITPEPYFMIDLPIPADNKTPSLIDCFQCYVEGETLSGDNAWYNEDTKTKIDIQKKITFWSFPNVLVIDLKRFNYHFQKNQILVTFPLEDLDLSGYVIGYKKDTYHYDLYGVCNHSGGVNGGHYTAYVKNANGNWYHFNDTMVTEVTKLDDIVSPKAYVLFYKKRVLL